MHDTHPPTSKSDSPAVLTIAGSDPSGGAGLQADLKTFAALNAYGMSVLTLATDCTTEGVDDLHVLPPESVIRQLERVARDVRPQALKTGMLFDADLIAAVTAAIDHLDLAPLVVDPVITSRRGETLLAPEAVAAMRSLTGKALVVTPSRPEAEVLADRGIDSRSDAEQVARTLHERLGCPHVVITGGHDEGAEAADLWLDGTETQWLTAERQPYPVHGAGDTFSAALTVGLAEGCPVGSSIRRAKAVVSAAIQHAPDRGEGHRPLAHGAVGDADVFPLSSVDLE
jgi:hydroxymethylpyrimidine/phosphomethylpyrimidine kinase